MYFSTENRMDTTEENNFDYEQSRVRVVNFYNYYCSSKCYKNDKCNYKTTRKEKKEQ